MGNILSNNAPSWAGGSNDTGGLDSNLGTFSTGGLYNGKLSSYVTPWAAAKTAQSALKKPSPDDSAINTVGDYNKSYYQSQLNNNNTLNTADTNYTKAIGASGQQYLNSLNASINPYKQGLYDLSQQASSQASDAQKTYSNEIQPKLTSMLDADYNQAYGVNGVGGAMSLQEAGDPNNAVQTAVRNMYNTQASNVQNQGLAASSVLGRLGAQNAASAFGGQGPMSVGQQQALYAASQGQAGQAFANAQQQMNNLRQQGILQGFTESANQYARGQQAKQMAQQDVGNLGAAQQNYLNQQQALRGEQGNLYGGMLGANLGQAQAQQAYDAGMANLGRGNTYNATNRQQATDTMNYANQIGQTNALFQNQQATNAAYNQMITGAVGGVGSVAGGIAGGIYGGPSGAMAGSQAGGAFGSTIGSAAGASQNPVTTQGTYTPYGMGSGGYGNFAGSSAGYSPYGQGAQSPYGNSPMYGAPR